MRLQLRQTEPSLLGFCSESRRMLEQHAAAMAQRTRLYLQSTTSALAQIWGHGVGCIPHQCSHTRAVSSQHLPPVLNPEAVLGLHSLASHQPGEHTTADCSPMQAAATSPSCHVGSRCADRDGPGGPWNPKHSFGDVFRSMQSQAEPATRPAFPVDAGSWPPQQPPHKPPDAIGTECAWKPADAGSRAQGVQTAINTTGLCFQQLHLSVMRLRVMRASGVASMAWEIPQRAPQEATSSAAWALRAAWSLPSGSWTWAIASCQSSPAWVYSSNLD